MEVTFDPAKDAENIRKHGISLQRADDFDEDAALILVDDSQDYGEVRYKAIGFLNATLYSLIFTMEPEEIIRAISLRKSTTQEQREYAEEY
jgi:uncharacterized DUF497 family protein